MRRKTVYLFLAEEYADWGISLAMAGLHSFSDIDVFTFSLRGEPVCSMGNLAVLSDMSLAEVDPEDIDLLVLPGSPLWVQDRNREIAPLVHQLLFMGKGVAAIGEATEFLEQMHVDNRLTGVITVEAPYSFQFAQEIFDYFGLMDSEVFQEWFRYFREGEKKLRRSGVVL